MSRASSCSLLLLKLDRTKKKKVHRRSFFLNNHSIDSTYRNNRFITVESNLNFQCFRHFPNLNENKKSRKKKKKRSKRFTSINEPIPAGINTNKLAPESSRYRKIITLLMERHKTEEENVFGFFEGQNDIFHRTGSQRQSDHCLSMSPIVNIIFKRQKVEKGLRK